MNEEENILVKIPKCALKIDWNESEHKLAHLLIENVIFINNGWWFEEEGIPWKKDAVSLHVNCNDIFSWGRADAEDITHSEINELYEMWTKDEYFGAAVWCIKKRKCMPQKPVEEAIHKQGIWNLEELIK